MRSLFALGNSRNSFLNSSVCDSSLAQGGPLPVDTTVATTKTNVEIVVYPNPFTSQINVTYKNSEENINSVARLYDVTGKIIISQTIQSQKTTIIVNNLLPGIYILKISGTEKQQIFKLLK